MEIWDDLSKEDLDACFVIIEMQNQTEMKKVAADEEPTMEEAKKTLAEATEAAVKAHPDLERFSPTKDSILFTKKLINLFCNVRDSTIFYAEYPKESPHSSQYFGISQKHAALLMIKVFDAIVKSNEHQSYDEVQTAENITDREEGIIEYIVGYALTMAKRKFPNNLEDIAKLCKEEAAFEFGQKVQRVKNRLQFPVREVYDLFRQIYSIFIAETNKSPKDINFNTFLKGIKSSSFYETFEDKLKYEHNMEKIPADVLNYIAKLFVKVLSYRFAKFLLNQSQKSTSKSTCSLRAGLNPNFCKHKNK